MKGKIYSETSYYVKQADGSFLDEFGNKLKIGPEYVDSVLKSAEDFSKEEKVTATQLAELFVNTPRVAMTVGFYKKAKAKTKTAFKKEVAAKVEEFENAKVKDIEALVMGLINEPLTDTNPPEFREMKGRHHGSIDDMGRVHFIDMEIPKDSSKEHDVRLRQVDPRTLQYIIVDNVKYSKK